MKKNSYFFKRQGCMVKHSIRIDDKIFDRKMITLSY
jgi:hypothetical protein